MQRLTRLAVTGCAPLFSLLACSTGSGGNVPVTHTEEARTRLETPAGVYDVTWDPERAVTSSTLLASVDRVWTLLPEVYSELGIDPTLVDSKERVYGNNNLRVRRELGRQPLSRYLDCGAQLGLPNADVYNITMVVVTQVLAEQGEYSAVRSQVSAYAQPEGVAGHPINCASTGRLEERIARMIADRVKRGS